MPTPALVLYLLIVGCEVAFWLVLLASLVARYRLRRPVLSTWLLRSLPAIDLLLLVFTAIDLKRGTVATPAHGLAAVYIGFTLAFGTVIVRWADARFAHRFASGAAPSAAPTRGWALVRFDLQLWLRCIAAWIVALALIEALIAYVRDPAITADLEDWSRHGFGCVVIWFVFGPVWSLLVAWRAPRGAA